MMLSAVRSQEWLVGDNGPFLPLINKRDAVPMLLDRCQIRQRFHEEVIELDCSGLELD